MMQRFIFLCLFYCFLSPISAQVNQQKLDRLFTGLYATGDFNGSVLVARQGEIIYEQQLGYANFEKKTPVTENTVFKLASVSKQFTAIGIMILKEQGKLSYDQAVINYLPGFPYSKITVRHLLNMASGIPDYMSFADQLPAGKIPTNQDVLEFYAKEKPTLKFPPNTQFSYANINYIILASIIERVAGQSFASFLQENIFLPAKMEATRSYTSQFTQGELLANYAFPYVQVDDQLTKAYENPATSYVIAGSALEGDGSIVSTPRDLLKWTNGLNNELFVSTATLAEAYTPPTFVDGTKGEYGFGIYIGKKKVWHWGGWPGVQTAYTRYLANDTVAIYFKNVESFNWKWVGQFERIVNK
ncbi:MAG: serine hydrolase domain-containing protein [Bacteroidota bacterium]